MRLGRQIRARRKDLRLTQRDVAELSGVGLSFIHDLENGKPSVHLAKTIAVAATLGLELNLSTVRRDS